MASPPERWVTYDAHQALAFSPHIIAKIYQLSSMFMAERALAKYSLDDARTGFKGRRVTTTELEVLRNELFLNTATSLLVEIAIFMRIIDDKFNGKYPISDRVSLDCGDMCLKDPNGNTKEVPLNFREACNKIIHGKEFSFLQQDVIGWEQFRSWRAPVFFYRPLVEFYGERGKDEWKAWLKVLDFCKIASMISRITLF